MKDVLAMEKRIKELEHKLYKEEEYSKRLSLENTRLNIEIKNRDLKDSKEINDLKVQLVKLRIENEDLKGLIEKSRRRGIMI